MKLHNDPNTSLPRLKWVLKINQSKAQLQGNFRLFSAKERKEILTTTINRRFFCRCQQRNKATTSCSQAIYEHGWRREKILWFSFSQKATIFFWKHQTHVFPPQFSLCFFVDWKIKKKSLLSETIEESTSFFERKHGNVLKFKILYKLATIHIIFVDSQNQ